MKSSNPLTMEMEDGKSYLISALRQRKQNENYVIFRQLEEEQEARKERILS